MKTLGLLTLLILEGCASLVHRTNSADWSGVDAFWRVYAELSADREPPAAMWERLWATPGYAKLQEREKRREILSEAYRLAYMPSLDVERKETLRTHVHARRWIALFLSHFVEIPANRIALNSFRARFEREHLLGRALVLAQTKLPPGLTLKTPPADISMAFIGGARGYDRIVLDPLEMLQHPLAVGLLAHELHHYYRRRIARIPKKPYGTDYLAWALEIVEEEGVACTLDKERVSMMTDNEIDRRFRDKNLAEYMKMYRNEYSRSAYWLHYFDERLQQAANKPSSANSIGSDLHDTPPDNARMVGAFMADTIVTELGASRLVLAVGDWALFWQTYNQAAARSDGKAYTLSSQAMAEIDAVHRTYFD